MCSFSNRRRRRASGFRTLASGLDASLNEGGRLHPDLTAELQPRIPVKDWPYGTPTSRVRFVAPMASNPRPSQAEFDACWRDEHPPIALVHSPHMLNFSQNIVLEHPSEGLIRSAGS